MATTPGRTPRHYLDLHVTVGVSDKSALTEWTVTPTGNQHLVFYVYNKPIFMKHGSELSELQSVLFSSLHFAFVCTNDIKM